MHYLITRFGSRRDRRKTGFNDCREPPYPVRDGCTRLLFLVEGETRTRGNASITCKATVASAPSRLEHFGGVHPRGRARRRRRHSLHRRRGSVGRRNWVNPTGRRCLFLRARLCCRRDEHGVYICQRARRTRFALSTAEIECTPRPRQEPA